MPLYDIVTPCSVSAVTRPDSSGGAVLAPLGDGPARLPCRDGQPASAGQDPAALSGRQLQVAELDGVDAHDRVSAMVADPEGGEVAHAEPGSAARPCVCGARDRHCEEIQADRAGAGPA